jgi:hypothetical protein
VLELIALIVMTRIVLIISHLIASSIVSIVVVMKVIDSSGTGTQMHKSILHLNEHLIHSSGSGLRSSRSEGTKSVLMWRQIDAIVSRRVLTNLKNSLGTDFSLNSSGRPLKHKSDYKLNISVKRCQKAYIISSEFEYVL